jgi:plasmid stability protein
MASITIRRMDEGLKSKLRMRAARHGRSMQEEAREILSLGLSTDSAPIQNLATAIREIFEPLGGVELEIPPREMPRRPPDFT